MQKKEIILMLTITDNCNLNCIYCYENKRTNQIMTLKTAKNILKEYLNKTEEYSFVHISLFGGEPFLFPELIKNICEWTWARNWKVSYLFDFSTNGTLFNSDIKQWLTQNSNRIKLNLSADGNKISQDVNRSQSFGQVEYDFFIKTWKNPAVKMTISKQSFPFLADNIIFFHELGFEFVECNFAEGINWEVDEKILIKESKKMVKYYKNHPEINVCPLFNFDFNPYLQTKSKEKKCGIGEHIFMYYMDGKLYPCNCVSPLDMNDAQLKVLENIDYTKNECLIDYDCMENCDFYSLCPTCYAANYLREGTLWKRNRKLCNILKIRVYYSAIIKATRILEQKDKIARMSEDEKMYYKYEIEAIENILSHKIFQNSKYSI